MFSKVLSLSSLFGLLSCSSGGNDVSTASSPHDPPENSSRDAGSSLEQDGGEPTGVATAVRCTPGTRRDATPEEGAQYCICPPETEIWTCYGPNPALVRDANAHCKSAFSLGDSSEGCTKTYSNCEDERSYLVSCTSSFCFCVIDAEPVAELEPGATCPGTLDEANQMCGWRLTGDGL